jgi:hypothetical protein
VGAIDEQTEDHAATDNGQATDSPCDALCGHFDQPKNAFEAGMKVAAKAASAAVQKNPGAES